MQPYRSTEADRNGPGGASGWKRPHGGFDGSDNALRQLFTFLAGTEGAYVFPIADEDPPTGGVGASAAGVGSGVGSPAPGSATRKVTKGYWEAFCDRVLRGLVKAICIVDFAYRDHRELNLAPDEQLLERAYCFTDPGTAVDGGHRLVVLHAHTMCKWVEAKRQHPRDRVDKLTAVNVRHANMAEDGSLVQEHGAESLGVVPVSRQLHDAWRGVLGEPRRTAEVEWCWHNPSSMPTRELRGHSVTETYQRLREVIALGQSLLDEHSVNDVWTESTGGLCQFNKMISNAPLLTRGGAGASSKARRECEIVALVRKKVVEEEAGGDGAGAASPKWVEPEWAELGLETPAKPPSPFKILFIGVNANESATLHLKQEYEAITRALDANARKFVLAHGMPVVKHIPYSTWREVMEEVKREHPSALQFGSHSSKARGIELFRKTVIPEQMKVAIRAWNEYARENGYNEVRPRSQPQCVLLACKKHACWHS